MNDNIYDIIYIIYDIIYDIIYIVYMISYIHNTWEASDGWSDDSDPDIASIGVLDTPPPTRSGTGAKAAGGADWTLANDIIGPIIYNTMHDIIGMNYDIIVMIS